MHRTLASLFQLVQETSSRFVAGPVIKLTVLWFVVRSLCLEWSRPSQAKRSCLRSAACCSSCHREWHQVSHCSAIHWPNMFDNSIRRMPSIGDNYSRNSLKTHYLRDLFLSLLSFQGSQYPCYGQRADRIWSLGCTTAGISRFV